MNVVRRYGGVRGISEVKPVNLSVQRGYRVFGASWLSHPPCRNGQCTERKSAHSTWPTVGQRTLATLRETPKVLINDLKSQEVVVEFNDGRAVRYPSFWLRDHCQCPDCTHPETNQRQVDTFSLSPDLKAATADPASTGLEVTWSEENHKSTYPWSWLEAHEPFTASPSPRHPRSDGQFVSPSLTGHPTVAFDDVMKTDAGLSDFLNQIRTYGLSFVVNTPPTPAATEALANRIAFIRQTHYGGFWEVVSKANPIDTAYTNLFLPNHTDNTYFTDPCGLQMFHCLSHSDANGDGPGEGGESTFVDGFAAAARLQQLSPEYYNILSNTGIVSHASGDPDAGDVINNAVHGTGFPVFTHSLPGSRPHPKNLTQVRWNNSDRHSSTVFSSHQAMKTWYAAARTWNELVQSPEFELTVKLTPGAPVVFDNWRTLHGRKAFSGVRKLCGAYIGMDDFLAKQRAVDKRLARHEQ